MTPAGVPDKGGRKLVGWQDGVILAALLSVFLLLACGVIPSGPYSYDESDYMYAASMGWLANYVDSPSRSVVDIVRIGLRFGRQESQRVDLSEYARASDDVNFYRHWHGPLYYYWLAAASPWKASEGAMRRLTLAFPILTCLAIYAGCLWVLPGAHRRLAAVVCSSLFLWSHPIVVSAEVAPHQLFVLCYVVSLLLAAKVMAAGQRNDWYGAVVVAGLAFCTLGVAFVLVVTLALVAWLERRRLAADWRFARNSALLFLGTVLMVWPAAILKLSILKTYMFMGYLALFRRAPWGEVTFFETWASRFRSSPVEWLLLAASVVVYFRLCRADSRRPALPFLVFGALMLVTLLRMKTAGPRYLTPFLPAFHVFMGLTLSLLVAARRAPARYGLLAVLCAMLLWNTERQLNAHPLKPAPRPRAVLALIRDRHLDNKALLVPQPDVPVLHYYFPRARLKGYLEESSIPAELSRRAFDAVLYSGYPVRLETPDQATSGRK